MYARKHPPVVVEVIVQHNNAQLCPNLTDLVSLIISEIPIVELEKRTACIQLKRKIILYAYSTSAKLKFPELADEQIYFHEKDGTILEEDVILDFLKENSRESILLIVCKIRATADEYRFLHPCTVQQFLQITSQLAKILSRGIDNPINSMIDRAFFILTPNAGFIKLKKAIFLVVATCLADEKKTEKRGIESFGHGGGHGGGFGGGGLGGGATVSTISQQVPVPVPQPYPVTVTRPVPVPVPAPYQVEVPRAVQVPVPVPRPVEVPRPYTVTVNRPVPVPVQVPVQVPYQVPVEVPVPQPYPVTVPQPFPVRVPQTIVVPVPEPVNIGGGGGGGFDGGHGIGGGHGGGYSYSSVSIGDHHFGTSSKH
ncbi:hypothetical protein TcasGA2_TC008214 [Tribolium castaneum]|uniref:Uncharacterized protein n=1 Tax=Tribolium castaneum TaxID=7070 RepID=D2A0I7_TRICA|nr:hypothetical protein TcasGA2_TC008214 [Tribolium castaneum]